MRKLPDDVVLELVGPDLGIFKPAHFVTESP